MSYKKEHTAYKNLGLHFLTLAINYLKLVKNVLGESIRQQNKHVVVMKSDITEKIYEEETKWSDFNVLIPVLFNFYHVIELLLKGHLCLIDKYDLKARHNAQELLEDFKKQFINEEPIVDILDRYLNCPSMPDLLAGFLRDNNMQIKDFYMFLRYPTDRNFQKTFDYIKLKYNSSKALEFFNEMVSDIDTLVRKSVRLYNSMEEK